MRVRCRDLGLTDYADCWALQRTLFDDLVARKTARTAATESGSAETTAAQEPTAAVTKIGATATDTREAATDRTAATVSAAAETDTDAARKIAEKSGSLPPTVQPADPTGTDPKNPGGDNSDDVGTVLLTEHRPVYTLGKSGHAENLLVDRSTLEAMGAQFFHIDRGGDITFHGPGQLVCYPILDLERLGLGLRGYIDALEEAVIRTVERFGIRAGRIAGASGVWIDPSGARARKICAIGVRSSRYVTMHGFALNVATDLRWFGHINPCGFTDRGVTSIAAETGSTPAMEQVKALVVKNLSEQLNVKIYNY